jgi:REP element-mobilizing transposase RayT
VVLASHGIFTAYGFWLPNDPRGSWSDFVRAWHLLRFGDATKVETTRSLARTPHNRNLRLKAKTELKYPPVHFTGIQARAIASGFARAVAESGYEILACSILPEHVHIVSVRHKFPVERIMGHLKGRATQQLTAENLYPIGELPSVWAHRSWKVFLNSNADIERAVRYVEENPIKEGFKKQNWSFLTTRAQSPSLAARRGDRCERPSPFPSPGKSGR